tara:strand:+ start:479 stop:706 length:228 start_codon:yes stop_codon:yes gene_type:complete
MKNTFIKASLTGFIIGLLFSVFYNGSSFVLCSWFITCSIGWKNYIIGTIVITSTFIIVCTSIAITIKYIYNITKV